MRKFGILFAAFIFLLSIAGYGFTQQVNLDKKYNPSAKYVGEYKEKILFFRHRPGDFWRRKPHMDRLRYVTCQDALEHLDREGKWKGILNPDGTCQLIGGAESLDWALGNRINYDEALVNQGN